MEAAAPQHALKVEARIPAISVPDPLPWRSLSSSDGTALCQLKHTAKSNLVPY
jgi:hypothetical protein